MENTLNNPLITIQKCFFMNTSVMYVKWQKLSIIYFKNSCFTTKQSLNICEKVIKMIQHL